MRTTIGVLAAIAVLGTTAAAPAATEPTEIVAGSGVLANPDGTGFAWQVRTYRKDVPTTLKGIKSIPEICLELDHAWEAEGTSMGNVGGGCVGGLVGNKRFTLFNPRCHGVSALSKTASRGPNLIRMVGLVMDARARQARLTFADGQRMTLAAAPAPKGVRLPVRLAWSVDAGTAALTRVVALNAKGKTFARWTPRPGYC